MTTELRFLAASVVLGLVHLIADSHLISFQYGYRWSASARDQPVPPLRGLASRVDQAYANFMETFPFFAALVLIAHVTGRDGALTLWGAHLYLWGRVGYLLAAALGYGLVRSAVCFNAALAGMVLFLVALLW
ncbi:MAG: MAPEG family protein [Chthoniobacterales bacterium]